MSPKSRTPITTEKQASWGKAVLFGPMPLICAWIIKRKENACISLYQLHAHLKIPMLRKVSIFCHVWRVTCTAIIYQGKMWLPWEKCYLPVCINANSLIRIFFSLQFVNDVFTQCVCETPQNLTICDWQQALKPYLLCLRGTDIPKENCATNIVIPSNKKHYA